MYIGKYDVGFYIPESLLEVFIYKVYYAKCEVFPPMPTRYIWFKYIFFLGLLISYQVQDDDLIRDLNDWSSSK